MKACQKEEIRKSNSEVQQKRLNNMYRDEKKFALINFEDLPNQVTFSLIDMIEDKQMNVRIKSESDVTCSCMDWRIRGRKNKFNCKHILYVVKQILNLDQKAAEFNVVEDFAAFRAAFHRIKIDYANNKIKDLGLLVPDDKKLTEEDICPICFVDFLSGSNANMINCTRCKNIVHLDCMKCWLKNAVNKRCVYCGDTDIAKIDK